MLSMIFPNCLSHIVFFFSSTKNNLIAGVSKGKYCPNSVTFFTAQSKLSVWEYHYYVCVSICVCGLLLRVSWWPKHRISSSGAYQSDSLPPSLVIKKITLFIGQCVCPQSSQAATFGIQVLVRKFEGITDSNQSEIYLLRLSI